MLFLWNSRSNWLNSSIYMVSKDFSKKFNICYFVNSCQRYLDITEFFKTFARAIQCPISGLIILRWSPFEIYKSKKYIFEFFWQAKFFAGSLTTNLQLKIKKRWSDDTGFLLSNDDIKSFFVNCFQTIDDNYYKYFQYRITSRILGTNQSLYKFQISDTPLCRLCNRNPETLIHLFVNCNKSKKLFHDIKTWILRRTGYEPPIYPDTNPLHILFGIPGNKNQNKPLNTVLLVAKNYIFISAWKRRELNIFEFQRKLSSVYHEQKALANINISGNLFSKNWFMWRTLFS